MRTAGILLPISALPSNYGIGCFSKEAYDFVDFLDESGQKMWQILPLGQTSYGDSPYQSFSTFAGNPYFISLEKLIEDKLITKADCDKLDFGKNKKKIDYGKMYKARYVILKKAFEKVKLEGNKEYEKFLKKNSHWIKDYSLYMAIKSAHDDECWDEWEEEIRLRKPAAVKEWEEKLKKDIEFYKWLQFEFDMQWRQLKAYANKKGILIVGDLPIYVAFDSSDAWANPKLFDFDKERHPISVAGCPPDAFTADGQLWGNPLYNWEAHKKTDYKWWTLRVKKAYEMYDVIRIDHFRGFESYYTIPAYAETARVGEWKKGPGIELFETIEKKLGKMDVIVEDLGFITDEVRNLVKATGWPNMKVLQFAFDSREDAGPSDYIPYMYDKNCVVYTGTHDNETMAGWLSHVNKNDLAMVKAYVGKSKCEDIKELVDSVIDLALASVAERAIIPMQDYLCLDNASRMNEPSTLGKNWMWRMAGNALTKKLAKDIKRRTKLYGRI